MTVTAAAAGTWQLGDLTVNRLGFGAVRLTGGAAFRRGTPGDRDRGHRSPRRSSPALRASRGRWGGTSGRSVRAAPLPRAAAGRG